MGHSTELIMTPNHFAELLNAADGAEVGYRTIDWGNSKSQGKRSGGTVKGGMGINLKGLVRYQYPIIDVPDIELIRGDLIRCRLDSPGLSRYQRCRNAGFTHRIAMIFAITGSIDKTFILAQKKGLFDNTNTEESSSQSV